jgi:3-mercaptopyruvate sulfurtransferase SseA
MRHLATAAAVVVFLTASLARAQTKPAAPPGAPSSTAPVTSAVAVPVPQTPLESARRITREEAIKLVDANKAVYVDVRAKVQYDQSHIKGAISIPLGEVVTRANELPPGKFIITYCA